MLNYHRRNNSRRDLTPFIPVIQTTNLGINALLTTVKTPLAVIPQLMGVNYGHSKFALFTIRPGKNNSSHPLLAHGIATPLAKGHDDTKVLHLTQRQSIWRKGAIAMQTPRAPVVCPSRDVPALSIGNRSCILRPAYIAASVLGIQIFVESELLYDVKEVEWLLMIHRLMEKEETALAIIYFDHAARHFSAKSATPSPGIKLVGISNDRSCLIIQAVNALQQVTLHDDSGLPALLQLNWSTLATKATGQEVENCS